METAVYSTIVCCVARYIEVCGKTPWGNQVPKYRRTYEAVPSYERVRGSRKKLESISPPQFDIEKIELRIKMRVSRDVELEFKDSDDARH